MKATLTYHSIDDSGSPISLSSNVFAAHVAWLTSGRVRVLPLEALLAHPDDGEDAVAVTFDDGISTTRSAIEMLIANGLPVTLFIVTGRVGATNQWGSRQPVAIPTLPLFGWSDLGHFVSRGAVVAAHTRTHRRLTRLTPEEVRDELEGCQHDLTERLGVSAAHLAYPFGDVDDRVLASAARTFHWGHSTDFGPVRSSDPPLRLPRLDMYYYRRPGDIECWGRPSFVRRMAWIRAMRAVGGRIRGPEQ